MVSFELSEEIQAVREAASRFAQKEIFPRVAEDEKKHQFQDNPAYIQIMPCFKRKSSVLG